jgi:S-adenosylmethionine hydrolase
MPIVTLITDFGLQDHYVACLKGEILSRAPQTVIVDVTHDVPAHNVLHAAFVLRQCFPHFPPKTIHALVVDPTVGGGRQILAARYSGQLVVAPDNGLVSLLHRDAQLEELRSVENLQLFSQPVSSTFHGRDIIGPIAGHLAAGGKLADVGPLKSRLELLDLPQPRTNPDNSTEGQVIYVDRFGNLVSNLHRSNLMRSLANLPNARVWLGAECVGPVRQSYQEVSAGETLALFGSAGLLEVAVNLGSAAQRLQATVGARVAVR